MSRISVKAGIAGTLAAAAALGTLGIGTASAATTPAITSTATKFAVAVETPAHGLKLYSAAVPSGAVTITTVAPGGIVHSAPSVVQVGGAIDIAAEGPSHSLLFFRKVGFIWKTTVVPGGAYSAPSLITVGGELAIAVQGPLDTLRFDWAPAASGPWFGLTVPSATTVTAPSLADYLGNPVIAAKSLGGALTVYPGPLWTPVTLGATSSTPSLTTYGPNLLLAAQAPGDNLRIFQTSGSPAGLGLTGVGKAYSAPSISDGAAPGRVNVAVQGAFGSLKNYTSANAGLTWSAIPQAVAGGLSASSAPSGTAYGPFNLITAAGVLGSLEVYSNVAGPAWTRHPLAGILSVA